MQKHSEDSVSALSGASPEQDITLELAIALERLVYAIEKPLSFGQQEERLQFRINESRRALDRFFAEAEADDLLQEQNSNYNADIAASLRR